MVVSAPVVAGALTAFLVWHRRRARTQNRQGGEELEFERRDPDRGPWS